MVNLDNFLNWNLARWVVSLPHPQICNYSDLNYFMFKICNYLDL